MGVGLPTSSGEEAVRDLDAVIARPSQGEDLMQPGRLSGTGKRYVAMETVGQTLRLDIADCVWLLRRQRPWAGNVPLFRKLPREQIDADSEFLVDRPGGKPKLLLSFSYRENGKEILVDDVVGYAATRT
jgi:hypothetical protein